MAVATSSHRDAFLLKSQNNGNLFQHFESNVVTGNEVAQGKPAPDLFLTAHARIHGEPSQRPTTIIFEDAPSGVRAAVRAGMPVVWIKDPRAPRDMDLEKQAWCVLESMEEMDPSWMGLPPFSTSE